MKYLCEQGHITEKTYYHPMPGISGNYCNECLMSVNGASSLFSLSPVYKIPEDYEVTKKQVINRSSEACKKVDIERRLTELESSFNALAEIFSGKERVK